MKILESALCGFVCSTCRRGWINTCVLHQENFKNKGTEQSHHRNSPAPEGPCIHRTDLTPSSPPNDPTSTSAESQTPKSHPLSGQGLPQVQDEAVIRQDGGFQGAGPRGSVAGAAGREVKQGQRSECNFPSRAREESSGQGEALIVLSQPAAFPAHHLAQPGAADVSCKSATAQKHPEGRMARCTDRDGETEEIAFSPGGLAGRGFHLHSGCRKCKA